MEELKGFPRWYEIRLCSPNLWHANSLFHVRVLIHEAWHFRNRCLNRLMDCSGEQAMNALYCACARGICNEMQARAIAGQCDMSTPEGRTSCFTDIWDDPAYRSRDKCSVLPRVEVEGMVATKCARVPTSGFARPEVSAPLVPR
jgi:hypothetical protein